MTRWQTALSSALLTLASGAMAMAATWTPVCEDDFTRLALGPDWKILRGDWQINAAGQLQIQRQWPSESLIASTIPLRGKNVRVDVDVRVPSALLGFKADAKAKEPIQRSTVVISLQAGALGWGGGGIDDRVSIRLEAGAAETNADIRLDTTVHLQLTLEDGRYEVRRDGKVISSGTVRQGKSLVNSALQFSATPCAVFDNLRIFTSPMAVPLPEVNAATPQENQKATVEAASFIDLKKADCGIQAAIDSLPPGGGVVILPAGTFPLRRFLDLHSHTTLKGQGPQTVLRCPDITGARVEQATSSGSVHRLTLAEPHDFRAGDAFAYGAPNLANASWGHPGTTPKDPRENRLLVLAVDGNTLTVSAPPPESKSGKTLAIAHFFPPICSYESEFAEVKDLAIEGPATNPAGCSGGFLTCPVTFGVTSNPRFTRLFIRNYPSDGISAQVSDDCRFLDNTLSGVAQGMHPGTTTLRNMAARNLSVSNRVGLYFCWYNQNGIYYRNLVKNFTGYPDAGDVFNTLSFNKLTDGMTITRGYNGCLFGNEMPSLQISTPAASAGPGGRTYDLPPRYFTIGYNRIGRIEQLTNAAGNVIAANTISNGAPDSIAPIPGLPALPERTAPVLPPGLPAPVLDGRAYVKPDAPDFGFQEALDKLAAKGGTLRLPGGRYALAVPLRIPSGVTLTGYGSGTILLPRGAVATLLDASASAGAAIRELAIEGTWGTQASRGPAIRANGAEGLAITAVDIRGWPGDGIRAESGRNLAVTDCRVLLCAGTAYAMAGVTGLVCETSSAVSCKTGFEVRGGGAAKLLGNIAGLNGGAGYRLDAPGVLVAGCNAHGNREEGLLVRGDGCVVAGNTSNGNNLGGGQAAGIRIAGGAARTRVLFNNCGDEQLRATQLVGIREEAGAEWSEIRFNHTATLCPRLGHETEPSLVALGKSGTVEGNWTDTLLPANSSLEAIEWWKRQPLTKARRSAMSRIESYMAIDSGPRHAPPQPCCGARSRSPARIVANKCRLGGV